MKKFSIIAILIITVATSCSKKSDVNSPVLQNSTTVVVMVESVTFDDKVDVSSPQAVVTVRF